MSEVSDLVKRTPRLRLDLGAGQNPREGFTPVDIVDCGNNNVIWDLTSGQRWPFESQSVEELCSSHFIEHIAADCVDIVKAFPPSVAKAIERVTGKPSELVRKVKQDRLFFFFDEAYRIIQPGGLFHLVWPSLKSVDAFQDPTHRRFLPLEFTHYLSKAGREAMRVTHYEVNCNWVVVEGSVRKHLEPQENRHGIVLDAGNWDRVWDAERAWSLTLRAEKPAENPG